MGRKVSLSILSGGVLCCMLFISSGLVACGTNANAANKPPVAAGQQHCGTIGRTPARGIAPTGHPEQVGNCFWQAYQHCKAASLIYTIGGIDTITTHIFVIQSHAAGCTVIDAVQFRVVPRPASSTKIYTCTEAKNSNATLSFVNCGADGTITVPIAPAARI